MLEELAPKWQAVRESLLRERRGGDRRRAPGAGPKQRLAFTERLLVTRVHLRLGLSHAALAELYRVDRSTVSGAIREVRPLLAARGFAVPDRPGLRLRTLEDLFAYADVEDVQLRIDGTEVQVRRPRAGRPGRKAFVSGKKRQNTIKTTTFCDAQGRTLFRGVVRPGRMHDQTAVRTEGIAEQFRRRPTVRAEADEGYRGLANEFPDQVSAPPKKPKDDTPQGEHHAWREQRRRQSSRRICVEHTNAEYKQWRPLQRFTGRRETYAETPLTIAALVSDRSARRATRRYEKQLPGNRVQIDVKFIEPIGAPAPTAQQPALVVGTTPKVRRRAKYYQFTAIDDCTRLRVLRIYPRCDQKTAIQFLDYVLERLPFRVEVIQTDNGAEFQSAFHWHALDKGIAHTYIKPASPHLNGKVERSHRIDAEEFYRKLAGVVIDDTGELNEKLREWEDYYNYHRPHGALGGQTPYERLKRKTQTQM
ncbi:transposase family protein [Streptomyces sp. NPDC050636]|uniref:transposase family protein n=1 Tax=Streptomyces sp. NPDC050636 TaxID=3154510 RepID=UPI00343D3876